MTAEAAREPRLASLDSLRGIAALAVVFYHCWLAALPELASGPAAAAHSVLSLLLRSAANVFLMGRAAVMLFFVLSGFVLARSLEGAHTPYAGYVVKRVLRIYPAFIVAVLLSWLLHEAIGIPHPESSALMERVNDPDLSLLGVLKALGLWGTAQSLNLDLVIWSLVHEMRVSLVFPWLLWSVRTAGARSLAAYAVLSALCTLGLLRQGQVAYGLVEDSFVRTLAVTGYFLVFFAGGAYLAIHRQRVAHRLARWPLPAKAALLALSVLTFLKGDHGAEAPSTALVDYAHGAASLGLIALVLGTPELGRMLGRSVLCRLGRLSYSLYLLHLPILYVVKQTFGAGRPLVTTVAVIALSLAAAEVLAYTIEFPFIHLGQRLARRRVLARRVA
jgi:peptidoglycan/LPS O-acetylase OafA/YrhL